jgi:hypothetical protein
MFDGGGRSKGNAMSDQLFILLQGLLAFGAPLALAFIELWKLRRKTPAPVGGGEPSVLAFVPRSRPAALPLPAPAQVNAVTRRAA